MLQQAQRISLHLIRHAQRVRQKLVVVLPVTHGAILGHRSYCHDFPVTTVASVSAYYTNPSTVNYPLIYSPGSPPTAPLDERLILLCDHGLDIPERQLQRWVTTCGLETVVKKARWYVHNRTAKRPVDGPGWLEWALLKDAGYPSAGYDETLYLTSAE
jgi:hypothetical protein